MQQYAMDLPWAKIESSKLQWVKRNQKTIQAKKYQGLYDALLESECREKGDPATYNLWVSKVLFRGIHGCHDHCQEVREAWLLHHLHHQP